MTLIQLFKAIADAIRNKKGTTDKIKAEDFPSAIESIASSENLDVELNEQDELLNNQDTGIQDIFDALENVGQSDYNSTFDGSALEQNTSTSSSSYLLNRLSKELNFKGTNIGSEWTSAAYMFYSCENLTKVDLSNFDFKNVTNVKDMFYSCKNLEIIKGINLDNGKITNADYLFYQCRELKKIDGILDLEQATSITNMFTNCGKLEEIKIRNLNASGIDLTVCTNLTYESLLYLINNLVPTETSKTLIIGTKNINKLTVDELAIGTSKGWTIK